MDSRYCLKVALPWTDAKLSWRALSKQSVAQESLRLKQEFVIFLFFNFFQRGGDFG